MKLYREGKKGFFLGYFRHQSRRYRIRTGTADERRAMKILKDEFEAVVTGRVAPRREARASFEEGCKLALADYELNRRRSLKSFRARIKLLKRHFGTWALVEVTSAAIGDFVLARRKEGAADATINADLNALRTIFRCAIRRTPPLLNAAPHIATFKLQNARKGFFEHAQFLAVLKRLPERYQDFVEFLYASGCRRGEASLVEHRQADFSGRVLRVEPEQTKSGEGRLIPLAGPLGGVVKRAYARRSPRTPLLFHDGGHRIHFGGSSPFAKAWKAACEGAGCAGMLVHDLRRTAVRNWRRATGDPFLSKAVSGHKTMSVFERYDIKDERDLLEAAEKLGDYLAGQPKKPKVVTMRRR